MTILIPVSRSDRHLGTPLAHHIKLLGGVAKHDLVLFYTGEEAQATAAEMEQVLTGVFNSIKRVPSGQTDETGWPKSANLTFQKAVIWIDENVKQGPWYFFELDNVPLRSNWADALEEAYVASGKPFLGVLHKTIWTDQNGVRTVEGAHMVGTGLYPVPFRRHSILYRFLNVTAFDVFLQNEIVPYAAHTELIQHNWSTMNYRKDSTGKIVCDPAPGRPGESLCEPIRPDALVLHGCKDGSIFTLFLAKANQKGSRK